MRDFLPEDVRRREHVIGVIARVYQRYGFEPLETPALENLQTLMGKYGEEGDRLIFKILKRGEDGRTGEADLALRYDLTVPLARVVAEHRAKLPKFFKRYQIQPVWRADRPQRGRFREFYQCDVDAIGSRSPVVEAELCAAASEALAELGFGDFVIRLNHRQALAGVLGAAGVPDERREDALISLDKLDKSGREAVYADLTGREVGRDAARRLLDFFDAVGGDRGGAGPGADRAADNEHVLARLGEFVASDEESARSVSSLREIVALCAGTPAAGRIRLDPSLARGLSYYTGAIMEIAVPDLAGSLGGGGRYDHLVGMFLGQDVPACGFSLGLERIIVVMSERGMFPPAMRATAADVMVALWNDPGRAHALRLARELREAGVRVDVYPDLDKIGRQFKYAADRGVPLVALIGDEEMASGTVTVKDMRSGEQQVVPRAAVAGHVGTRLAPESGARQGAARRR